MLSQKVFGIEDAKFLRMMAAHNALETEQLDAEKQLYVISKMTGQGLGHWLEAATKLKTLKLHNHEKLFKQLDYM